MIKNSRKNYLKLFILFHVYDRISSGYLLLSISFSQPSSHPPSYSTSQLTSS